MVLRTVAFSKGTEAALKTYHNLKKGQRPSFTPDGETLISLVYWLHGEGKLNDALRIAKLEVEEYPGYWNAFDTLGEMYMHAGEKRLAIQNYEISIALNRKNENGIQMRKQLRHRPQ